MNYRPEIDGLRALALLPVILYHAGFHTFSGGFVGVDVFFVISGYLITSIILAERQSGSFTLISFYIRRARRILPVLYFILLVSSIVCLFLLSPFDGRDFWQSQSATILFATNFLFFLKSSDYFGLASEYKPLLHTWSLAVEEQYYLLYPLILLAAWRLGTTRRIVMLAAIAVISLAVAQWAAYNNSAAGFFLLPTRGWELLMGAFIAFYFSGNKLWLENTPQSKILNELGGVVGLGMIGLAVFLYDKSTPFPSLFTLLPTVGAALIILYANPQTQVGRMLSRKCFVGVGLISYSAYLWHQPLLAFARYYFLSDLNTAQSMIAIALTFGLAALTWRFIEQPCRSISVVSNRTLLPVLAGSSLILFSMGVFGHISNGHQNAKLSFVADSKRGVFVDFFSELSRKQKLWMEISKRNGTNFSNDSRKKILILGDSMSGDFLMALTINEKSLKRNEFIRQDLPAPLMSSFLEYIKKSGGIENTMHSPMANFRGLVQLIANSDEIVFAANWAPATIPAGVRLAEYLAKDNKKVYIVDAPKFFHMSASSYYFADSNLPMNELNHFMYKRLSFDYISARDYLNYYFHREKYTKIKRIDKSEYFCDFKFATCSLYSSDGLPLFFDELHLTIEGVKYFGDRLEMAGYFAR